MYWSLVQIKRMLFLTLGNYKVRIVRRECSESYLIRTAMIQQDQHLTLYAQGKILKAIR